MSTSVRNMTHSFDDMIINGEKSRFSRMSVMCLLVGHRITIFKADESRLSVIRLRYTDRLESNTNSSFLMFH